MQYKYVCQNCGKTFYNKRNSKLIRFCCKKCRDNSRYGESREKQRKKSEADKKTVIELYYTEKTVDEICELVGRSQTYLYNAWRDAGLPRRLTKHQRDIKSLREQGLCCAEITDLVGLTAQEVNHIAKSIGLPFTKEEKRKSICVAARKASDTRNGDEDLKREKTKDFIDRYHPKFSYIDGFINSDDVIVMRCNDCGSLVRKSAVAVRRRDATLICPECQESARIQRREEKEKERERREQEKFDRIWSKEFVQMSIQFKQCPYCGVYHAGGKSVYCSDRCKKKSLNRRLDKRVRRIYRRDSDITLKKLYDRDGGICWLCGKECDYDDYYITEEGYFVTGANYPSVDHVYPLSKGGLHSWDNVKLAHHLCNTLKRDKVIGQ